jgi:signal transduction histidine kinase
VRIARLVPTGDPPLRTLIRVAMLAVVVAAILAHGEPRGVTAPLVAVAAVGWWGWATGGYRRPARTAACILALGVAGGLVALWVPIAVGFLAAAGVAAGTSFDLRRAVPLSMAGPLALAGGSAVHGWSLGLVVGGCAAALAGLLGGVARRQTAERAEQAARTALARELHDVLAHTLSALAVQLEAAEAVLEVGDTVALREVLDRSRRLVATGMDEAAGAVRALRDEPVAIADRLADLVADARVPLQVEGTPRALPPDAGIALYRATQEALSNARKHAPGAQTTVSLAFRRDATVVTVRNGRGNGHVHAPGAGLGLHGMRERLELAGGELEAQSSDEGFTVEARVPA